MRQEDAIAVMQLAECFVQAKDLIWWEGFMQLVIAEEDVEPSEPGQL